MPTVTGILTNLLSRLAPSLVNKRSRQQVAEFRASGGTKGNKLFGKPTFVLDVVGRTSGKSRPVMLMLARRDDDLLIAASNGGNPEHPNWYRNLMAAGKAHVEVGADRWAVTVRELDEGRERDDAWERLCDVWPNYASYQQLTKRRIPVIVLERTGEARD